MSDTRSLMHHQQQPRQAGSRSVSGSVLGLPSQPQSTGTLDQSCGGGPKGLLNMPGENNCFLNSAVQVLWHLDAFRRSFRLLSAHYCQGRQSCIFCALKVLFTQFQFSDQSAVANDILRRALANAFTVEQRYQLGHMDDAAECFENILHRIHFHTVRPEECKDDLCTAQHCISHQKFAMQIREQVSCRCGAQTDSAPYAQMIQYVSATALASQVRHMRQHGVYNPELFGQLLHKAANLGDIRDCPKACGRKVQLRRTLNSAPDVVSLGMVWDSDRPDGKTVAEVAQSIGTSIRLVDLFDWAAVDENLAYEHLELFGVVCYYGKHYSSFVHHGNMQSWIYFDDAQWREVGHTWADTLHHIVSGRYQPLLLLYTRADPNPINAAGALRKTEPAPAGWGGENNNSLGRRSAHSRTSSASDEGLLGGNPYMHMQEEAVPGNLSRNHSRQGSFMHAVGDLKTAPAPGRPLPASSGAGTGILKPKSYINPKTVETVMQMQRAQQRQRHLAAPAPASAPAPGVDSLTANFSKLGPRDSGYAEETTPPVMPPMPPQPQSLAHLQQVHQVHQQQQQQQRMYAHRSDTSSGGSSSARGSEPIYLHNRELRGPPQESSASRLSSIEMMGFRQQYDDLIAKAVGLIQQSEKQKTDGDLAMALFHLTQATICFKQAVDTPYIGAESRRDAEAWHSECVRRCQGLQGAVVNRHDSGHSTMSEVSDPLVPPAKPKKPPPPARTVSIKKSESFDDGHKSTRDDEVFAPPASKTIQEETEEVTPDYCTLPRGKKAKMRQQQTQQQRHNSCTTSDAEMVWSTNTPTTPQSESSSKCPRCQSADGWLADTRVCLACDLHQPAAAPGDSSVPLPGMRSATSVPTLTNLFLTNNTSNSNKSSARASYYQQLQSTFHSRSYDQTCVGPGAAAASLSSSTGHIPQAAPGSAPTNAHVST